MKQAVNSRMIVGFLIMASLYGSGCDSFGGGEDTVPISVNSEFCFQFKSDTLMVGQPVRLFSMETQSLVDALALQGFTPSEIESASLESAVLEIIFPSDAPISFLTDVDLNLQSAGATDSHIADQTDFPTDPNLDTVSLDIDTAGNLVPHIRKNSFSAYLDLTPASLDPGEVYELQTRLRMVVRLPF